MINLRFLIFVGIILGILTLDWQNFLYQLPGQAFYTPKKALKAGSLYKQGVFGQGVGIAVIDEGFDSLHPGLRDRISNASLNLRPGEMLQESISYDPKRGYVWDSHGTHVSGLIAGETTGIAPKSTLFPFTLRDTYGGDRAFARIIEEAFTAPARIINLSLKLSFTGRLDPRVKDVLRKGVENGKLFIIAAGNEGRNLLDTPYGYALLALAHDPKMLGGILVVGALSYSIGTGWIRAPFSNWVPQAHPLSKSFVYAPGFNVLSTVNGGKRDRMSGTSMAAPLVSGSAALLMNAFPFLPSKEIGKLLIQGSGDPKHINLAQSFALGTRKDTQYPKK